ncbi:unnamed protein product [Clavelina lepadiformis]|uniref:Uncharacterized protein n=1 Tax=Clavelina lepadiformis TaxID=159417 RepID=A0ABP0GJY6_CLALP
MYLNFFKPCQLVDEYRQRIVRNFAVDGDNVGNKTHTTKHGRWVDEAMCEGRGLTLQNTGVRMPSQADVSKAITKAEMAWNCRRKTRGISVTTSKVEALVDPPAPRWMSLKFSSRKRKSLRSYKSKRGKYYEKGGSPTLEQEGLKAGQQEIN